MSLSDTLTDTPNCQKETAGLSFLLTPPHPYGDGVGCVSKKENESPQALGVLIDTTICQ